MREIMFLTNYFLLPISQLCWNVSFLRKAVLPRHAKSSWLHWCCFYFVSVSIGATIQPTWPRLMLSLGILFGAALAPAHQGIALGVSKPVGSTLPLLALRGYLGELNCQRWAACSIVLACPCWSLEGLLFVTQKTCLRKSKHLASNKHLIVLCTVRLRSCHGTTGLICGTHISVTLSTLNWRKHPKNEER